MTNNQDDINAKVDEYHLMIEEVLGGLDTMLTRLDRRVSIIEKALEIQISKNLSNPENEIGSLREKLSEFKNEFTEGLNLAFRKINEK